MSEAIIMQLIKAIELDMYDERFSKKHFSMFKNIIKILKEYNLMFEKMKENIVHLGNLEKMLSQLDKIIKDNNEMMQDFKGFLEDKNIMGELNEDDNYVF